MAAARDRRSSSTSGLRPFSARYALIAVSAACGLSGCTGFFAYSGDTNEKEQPPNGFHRQGRRSSAKAGVARRVSIAIMQARRIVPRHVLARRFSRDFNREQLRHQRAQSVRGGLCALRVGLNLGRRSSAHANRAFPRLAEPLRAPAAGRSGVPTKMSLKAQA